MWSAAVVFVFLSFFLGGLPGALQLYPSRFALPSLSLVVVPQIARFDPLAWVAGSMTGAAAAGGPRLGNTREF